MIPAGTLNRRLTIFRMEESRSSTGAPVATPKRLATVYAAREALQLRDVNRAAGLAQGVDAKFVIRWRNGIDITCQVECEGQTFQVVGVDERGFRQGLVLLARAI